MVEIYRDRVEISDPGGLPAGLKLSELGHRSMHRNPVIAGLFHRMGEVEKVGSGINRMKAAAKKAGVAPPVFSVNGFFATTFTRMNVEAQDKAQDRVQVGVPANVPINVPANVPVNERQKWLLEHLARHGKITSKELQGKFGDVSLKTIKRDLGSLKKEGIIRFVGASKNGYYVLVEK